MCASGDVEAICRDMQECYQVRRSHIVIGAATDYLNLVEWCLRHSLPHEAEAALAEATVVEPNHPKLGVLRRRLELALAQPATSTVSETRSVEQTSLEELDRAVRSLPPRSMEQFTTTIQPLLLNHCATAGCHGPQSSSDFHLLRLPANRTASRRSTQRNLVAALAMIDRDDPSASPLLTAPSGPHGTTTSAIFSKHQSQQFRQMVDWVSLVCGRRVEPLARDAEGPTEMAPARLSPAMHEARPISASERRAGKNANGERTASGERSSAGDGQAFDRASPWATAPAATPASASLPAMRPGVPNAGAPGGPAANSPAPARASRSELPLSGKPVQRGAAVETFTPTDEFDPAIFNRSQAGRTP